MKNKNTKDLANALIKETEINANYKLASAEIEAGELYEAVTENAPYSDIAGYKMIAVDGDLADTHGS